MRITVTAPIAETGPHGTLPPGEYAAEHSTPTHRVHDHNRRPCDGWFVYGPNRTEYMVMEYDWEILNDEGIITEVKEEDKMQTLPAVKMESAVVTVSPQEQINQASDMARLLKEVVSKAGLARKLGGRKEHLEFEAWQTIARWHHCTPSTEWTRPIKEGERIVGWEARVNVLDEQGRIIGSSEGMCMADEQNWRGKPSYALRSMAQTRTAGKALRSLFAHIAVLAGYSPTPAEEMDGVEVREERQQAAPPAANGDEATPAQKKKMYAMATERFGTKEKALEFITWAKGDEPVWTKKMASDLFDAFADQAALFADSQREA